jgi:hypothetical protein
MFSLCIATCLLQKIPKIYIYILGKDNPWGERAIEVVFVGTTWDSHAIGHVSV